MLVHQRVIKWNKELKMSMMSEKEQGWCEYHHVEWGPHSNQHEMWFFEAHSKAPVSLEICDLLRMMMMMMMMMMLLLLLVLVV